jgi:hypothetical protein
MFNHDEMASVAEQMMKRDSVQAGDRSIPVLHTSSQRLRTVRFKIAGHEFQAIEQNPEKPSRWGELARKGHKVVQFREVSSGKYVAVWVDGKVTEYGRSSA